MVLALPVLLAAAATFPGPRPSGEILLPNGRLLTPSGRQVAVAPYPFSLVPTPDGRRLVVASVGPDDRYLQLLDARSGRLLSSVPLPKAWIGLALSRDGRTAWVSGANRNAVLAFGLEGDTLVPAGEIPTTVPGEKGVRALPGGLALAADGKTLFAARTEADDVVRLDLATRTVASRWAVGRKPYRPVLSPDGRLLAVSLWGEAAVALLDAGSGRILARVATLDHPCDLVFSPDGARLYAAQANRNAVAIVDVAARRVVRQVSVAMGPGGPGSASAEAMPDGSTPNALALSKDGRTLFVANADDDAVAVVDVSGRAGEARTRGFVPSGWYPAALALSRDGKTLFVGNAKGSGSRANAKDGPSPSAPSGSAVPAGATRRIPGSVSLVAVPDAAELARLTKRAYANRKPGAVDPVSVPSNAVVPAPGGAPSPVRHVFYVIRENRTYDQVLGDVGRGNGDASLTLFGRDATPNAHALVDEYVLLDNFYADAEVSADGHNWSMASYATDFVEKTWVPNYGSMGFSYVYEGGDPIASPTAGYIWDAAARKGLSIRNYGEFVGVAPEAPVSSWDGRFEGKTDVLRGNTCPFYPGFDTEVLDVARVDLWLKEFRKQVADGNVPRLTILRLGNDHTEGTRLGARTPRAMVGDNDLALGRLVEAISASPVWKESAIFVLEDDAQNGPDHVDAHRTVGLVVSPFTRRAGAVDSTLYSTTSMVRTIELILGLPPLSQHDASATPMTAAFAEVPDATPFRHRPVAVDLYETNAPGAPMQAECGTWDFSREDATPEIPLNEAIWKSVKGAASEMPAPVNAAFVRPSGGEAREDGDRAE
ncbi:MAG: beta-propeller fold lactonase family protein [Thermoanaerobaculia bacterium]